MYKKIIVFEGVDGTGKSYHINQVAKFLKSKKIKFIKFREPGGSSNSEIIRKIILKNNSSLSKESDLLLYLAARKESVGKQMRTFMDNYYRFDPEYSAMSDAERDAFVARYNMKKGGIMNVPVRTNSEGVKELDYRKTGGFVPIGVKEKADDVPAMLSKNEFVFTADAVRGAGDGSIKKGAQRMYNTMKKLESRVG